jgi:hypothetical protein
LQIEASAELPHPKTLAVSLVGIGREFFKKKCLSKRLPGESFLSLKNKWLYNYYLKCDECKRTLLNPRILQYILNYFDQGFVDGVPVF